MKLRLTTMGKVMIREYKAKHYDWVMRMSCHTLEAMDTKIKYNKFPPNYCLQYRDSGFVDQADLSATTSKLRIEIEAAAAVLLAILGSEQPKMDDDTRIAGVVRLLEQVEVELTSSESLQRDILVDPEDFMDGLSICIRLLKLHLELFTVGGKELE